MGVARSFSARFAVPGAVVAALSLVVAPTATSAAADEASVLTQVPSTVLVESSELPAAVDAVALTDETVYVQVAGDSGPEVMYRDRDGGEWLNYWEVGTPPDTTSPISGELLEAEGDALLVRELYRDRAYSRTVSAQSWGFPHGSDLAAGGNLISWVDTGTGYLQIKSVDGYDEWSRLSGGTGNTILGDHLVTRHSGSMYLSSIDARQQLRYELGLCAAPATFAPSDFYDGRFAFEPCADGTIDVVDFAHVYTPWKLNTVNLDPASARAAKGLVVGRDATTSELVAAPVAGEAPLTIGTAADYDLDDAMTGLAYLDETGDVRLADLTGLGSVLSETSLDVTAPIIIFSVGYTSSLTSVMSMRAYDSPSPDPTLHESGVASVQTRYRTRAATDVEFSDWIVKEPIATIDGLGATDTAVGEPGGTVCMSARSIDNAGNMSEWADEVCNQLDGEAPHVTPLPLPATTRATGETTTVVFDWDVAENEGVAQSEVRYTLTPRGQEAGEWMYAKPFEWTFSVDSPVLTNVCFSVRAVDRATNASDWSDTVCTFVTADAA